MKKEEQNEIKKFFMVLGIIVLFLAGILLFTRVFVTDEINTNPEEEETIAGVINYNMAIVGNMLTRPEEEYYVFVYDQESTDAELYSAMDAINLYLQTEDIDTVNKVYSVLLSSHLNESYKVGEEEEPNSKATSVDEFKFGTFTLIKVKNGKVNKYMETVSAIEKELDVEIS